jgi:hypothetical protein
MKTKLMNRYYCDFCGKSGCAKGHMLKHERHCTLNPERECGVCGGMCKPDKDALPAFPTLEEVTRYNECGEYYVLPDDFVGIEEDVLAACDGCPTCAFAVLRQTGLPMYVFEFKYKDALAAWWSDKNEETRGYDGY